MAEIFLCESQIEWDENVLSLDGHPLQMWGWGELKSKHNWSAVRLIAKEQGEPIGGAQVLFRTLPKPFRQLAYVPRGPYWAKGKGSDVLSSIADYVKEHFGGVCLTIEPDSEELPDINGWVASKNTILIPRTLILDLSKSEDDLQAAMAKKTRQYIRKSAKEQLEIRRVTDTKELDKCLNIYRQTADRAGFAIHSDAYYRDVHAELGDYSLIFASFKDEEPVAFVWLAISGSTAFELYGGMSEEGQKLRANYALKWHAITKCREWGIERYDMNGLLNDGISTFKQSFADHENLLVGTYDFPMSPLYKTWTHGLPAAKKAIRKIKSLR